MSEWWTYNPHDLLMFSPETYYRQFELHNTALWPLHLMALAGGLTILGLLVKPPAWAGRLIAALLAATWAFVAYAYFFVRYATISLAAPYYGWAFLAQAALFLLVGTGLGKLHFTHARRDLRAAGVGLYLAGLILLPLMALVFGRPPGQFEFFGIAPDPTVVGTLGVLAAADRMRWLLVIIPVLWTAMTGVTLWTMGSPDAGIAGLAALCAIGIGLMRLRGGPES
jgi:hypothetical protein